MKIIWQIMRGVADNFIDISPRSKPADSAAEVVSVKHLVLSFWLVMLGGFIALFGFEDRWLAPKLAPMLQVFGDTRRVDAYASWELGALVWNALFAIYFYMKVPVPDKKWLERLTSATVLLGVGICTIMALRTLVASDPSLASSHVLWVLLIGIIFMILDGLHAKMQKNHRDQLEFKQCLLLADLPMVPALAVLWYYQYQRGAGTDIKAEELDVFLSGAISFQLIASNLIFACIQAGVFHQLFGRLSHGPEAAMAQAQPHRPETAMAQAR